MRRGRCNVPIYWLVAAHSETKRDGKFLAKVGIYMPLLSENKFSVTDEEKLLFYMKNGAEPTDRVVRLLNNIYKEQVEHEIHIPLKRYLGCIYKG